MNGAAEQIAMGPLPKLVRILLVTDFSPCSEAAVPVAKLLAGSYGGTVTAAHVILRDQDVGPNEAVIGTPEEIAELAEDQMTAFLAKNSLPEAESVIASGPFEGAIATLVSERQIDAVVVGTHGRSAVGKIMLGSIAQRIFNSVPCPVVTVSSKAHVHSWMGTKLTRILYITDMSETSLMALPYALSLATAHNAELLLTYAPEDSAEDKRWDQDLAKLIPPAARNWCRLAEMPVEDDPASGIVALAASNAVDFIVMGTERVTAGPLYRFNVPFTTAYQIVANAPCPVLRCALTASNSNSPR